MQVRTNLETSSQLNTVFMDESNMGFSKTKNQSSSMALLAHPLFHLPSVVTALHPKPGTVMPSVIHIWKRRLFQGWIFNPWLLNQEPTIQ
ncbi:hypothetical protein L2E82_24486 [Cichorium intybus]|uniref:Uncharacterized protein n=1 Tax=Cichorium intybus TaxID=13427 RepID=A0ACB9E0G4_CICIN|nr:hypothetical protein L2E82_24486 [Cichorium intybus]